MPNIKQQKKRVRIAGAGAAREPPLRLDREDADPPPAGGRRRGRPATQVADEHRELVRWIDKAASRGALHRNAAARKKAQAARLVAGLGLLASSRRSSPVSAGRG